MSKTSTKDINSSKESSDTKSSDTDSVKKKAASKIFNIDGAEKTDTIKKFGKISKDSFAKTTKSEKENNADIKPKITVKTTDISENKIHKISSNLENEETEITVESRKIFFLDWDIKFTIGLFIVIIAVNISLAIWLSDSTNKTTKDSIAKNSITTAIAKKSPIKKSPTKYNNEINNYNKEISPIDKDLLLYQLNKTNE